MINGNISTISIKLCLKRAFAVEFRLLNGKPYKFILHTFLRRTDIIGIAMEIKHKAISKFADDLEHTTVITCKETAVTTFTVIHSSDFFRYDHNFFLIRRNESGKRLSGFMLK